jgi:hypothetical protein
MRCLYFAIFSACESFAYEYHPSKAGWLDTFRLKVPYWRDQVECVHSAISPITRFLLC